jgi:predicted dehydrogenase
LPNVSKLNCELRTLVENNTINCHIVSKKYKIEHTASDIAGILNDEKINTVFITTPHHLHCRQIIQALQAGKHVFVEKPLAINEEELNKIDFVYKKTDKLLIVGFNRRFF